MAKTKEELNELKKEFEALKSKLENLNEDEIEQVVAGNTIPLPDGDNFWHSFNPFDNLKIK